MDQLVTSTLAILLTIIVSTEGNPKDGPKGGPPKVNLTSIMANSQVTLSCITFNIESLPRAAGDNHRSTRSCAVIKGAIKTLWMNAMMEF
ncbi:hypothetical protein Ocin01_19837 [Orchesella cincta]|uniref:Uncharacterized protein n=1 Tax=Orchesella cincta TaxID=48709 RepID=A0A1D2M1K0_ORCCI|nr:hypothetical protein Ocin01_19837 [Orchesella cincta]